MERYGVIYLIINKVNNKIYVGQTTKDFNSRYNGDIVKNTHNEHLRRSILKHGIDNFEIIEEYKEAYSKEELDYLECYYINIFDSTDPQKGYNKMTGGSSGRPSKETRDKMSKAHKDKVFTKETRDKMSAYAKNRTPEHTKKLSDGRKGENHWYYGKTGADLPTSIKIVMLDKQTGEFIKVWDCARDVARWLKINNASHISSVCKGKRKTAYGYKWAYYEEYIKEHPEILEAV